MARVLKDDGNKLTTTDARFLVLRDEFPLTNRADGPKLLQEGMP
jgi:hypothetical protein